jgi:hypothetical protein
MTVLLPTTTGVPGTKQQTPLDSPFKIDQHKTACPVGFLSCCRLESEGLFNEIRCLPLPLNCESAAWNANFVGVLPLI